MFRATKLLKPRHWIAIEISIGECATNTRAATRVRNLFRRATQIRRVMTLVERNVLPGLISSAMQPAATCERGLRIAPESRSQTPKVFTDTSWNGTRKAG